MKKYFIVELKDGKFVAIMSRPFNCESEALLATIGLLKVEGEMHDVWSEEKIEQWIRENCAK